MSRNKIERYIPTIGLPNWNSKEMSREEKERFKKDRIVVRMVDNEFDYQRVITYLYSKFPFEADGMKSPETGKKNVAIEWRYHAGKNAVPVTNHKTKKKQSMYAFILYDKERDMEPIAYSGSYFTLGKRMEENDKDDINVLFRTDSDGNLDVDGKYQIYGNGIVLFCDPAYRMGLGVDLWVQEAEFYREAMRIRFQKEIQNTYSLESTKKMYDDPSKCIITSEGRLKSDGTRSQIRCLLDYTDNSLINKFKQLPDGMKTIYEHADWRFMKREGFTDEMVRNIWEAGKLV